MRDETVRGFGHGVRTRNWTALTEVLRFEPFRLKLCAVCDAVLDPGHDDMARGRCVICQKGVRHGT